MANGSRKISPGIMMRKLRKKEEKKPVEAIISASFMSCLPRSFETVVPLPCPKKNPIAWIMA